MANLQRQYADMQAEEERLTVASQRLQAKVDAFRTRKEAIKAAHAAAQAAAEVAWAEAVIDDADTDANAEGAGSAADDAVNAESPDPARPRCRSANCGRAHPSRPIPASCSQSSPRHCGTPGRRHGG
jgi:hypothetical protein